MQTILPFKLKFIITITKYMVQQLNNRLIHYFMCRYHRMHLSCTYITQ